MTSKEALKGIKQAIAEHLHKQTGVSVEKHFEYLQYDTEIEIVEKALNELEELKKTPTVEEVFKALSEFTKQEVRYSLQTKQFYYYIEDTTHVMFITETYGDGLWSLGVYLSPHLITMIGRFYEGLK